MPSLKNWIQAFRLRTLPLAFSGWLVGSALAISKGSMSWSISLLTLFTAFLLQILSNLANDYGDAVSGVDSDHRAGPDRMVQKGAITKKAMGKSIFVFATLSLISGALLLLLAFPDDFIKAGIFLFIGLGGIAAAIKYTVGKNPYGYAGFGDVFVFFFFGIVLVFGTYFLQVGSFDWNVLLPSTSIGLLSVGVLNVNNIRDIESDKLSGKYSIPVRLGKKMAVVYHIFLLLGAMLTSIIFVILNFTSWWQVIFLPVIGLLLMNIKAVNTKSAAELDSFLKQMAISALIFALLFSGGHLLSWFF